MKKTIMTILALTVAWEINNAYADCAKDAEDTSQQVQRTQVLAALKPDDAKLLNKAGLILYETGNYTDAESLFLQSLAVSEKNLGKYHLDVAQILSNLATAYYRHGKYTDCKLEQAKPFFERSLAIREKILGKSHPDVAVSLGNLADFYQSQGLYEHAESLYSRSLAIREKALAANNSENLALLYATYHNLESLVSVYAVQGKNNQLNLLATRRGTILQQLLKKDPTLSNFNRYESDLTSKERKLNLDDAKILNEVGLVLSKAGDYTHAEPLFLYTLTIQKKILGEDHPDVAKTSNNLALLNDKRGGYDKAKSLYVGDLLAIEEKNKSTRNDARVNLQKQYTRNNSDNEIKKSSELSEDTTSVCSSFATMKVCSPESFKKSVIDKIRKDTKELIDSLNTVNRPEYVKTQNLLVGIQESSQLTKIYNQLLQAVFNDIEHYKKISEEVSKDYNNGIIKTINIKNESDFEIDGLNVGFENISNIGNARASVVPKMLMSSWEAEYLSNEYKHNILSSPRKVYLTQTGREHSPENKYGDVYINKQTIDKYKNDKDLLSTILLHEAFHVFVMPKLELSQMIENGLSAVVFAGLSQDKFGRPIDKAMAEEYMHEWSEGKLPRDEFEIDRLTMLHLRGNKVMRQKYLAVLTSVPKNNSPRLIAANLLDKYIDDEHDINILEHNLINIKAELMGSMNIAPNPLPPSEFALMQSLHYKLADGHVSDKEKEKIKLQLEKMINQSNRSNYKLRPHAVGANSDNYKEYMSIVINEINNPGNNNGEF